VTICGDSLEGALISAPSLSDKPSASRKSKKVFWRVGFMEYDLGYLDLEEKTLQPLDHPFGPKV
jgi:hypothetical protein